MTQAVNGISYVVSMLAIFGTCELLGCRRFPSALAAMVFGLLPICMLQAVTTQTDMQFAGWVAIAMYQLVHFRVHRRTRDLVLAAVAAMLPLGVKSSAFLVLPALGLLVIYSAWGESNFARRLRSLAIFTFAAGVAFVLLVLPTGYLGNIIRFGHPMGSEGFRRLHSFEGRSPREIVAYGSTNVIRYGLSFGRLDGQPRNIAALQKLYLQPACQQLENLGVALSQPEALRVPEWPFYDCLIGASNCEDSSWWGILGLLLIWPSVLWALCARGMPTGVRVLAAGCILFLLTQSFSGPYDPWRGRYFIHGALFAIPCVGLFLNSLRSRLSISIAPVVLCLGLESGVSTLWLQLADRSPDRTKEMLTRNPALIEPVRQYEKLVPPGSKVAFLLAGDSYIYPFFGAKLDRELHSAKDILHEGPLNLGDADYFLYRSEGTPMEKSDVCLGQDLYLRDLSSTRNSARSRSGATIR